MLFTRMGGVRNIYNNCLRRHQILKTTHVYFAAATILSLVLFAFSWFAYAAYFQQDNIHIWTKANRLKLIAMDSGHSFAVEVATDHRQDTMCSISCTPHQPCSYKDELDLRVIVLTFNRPNSLKKCLDSLTHLKTLGDQVSIEIWIDRSETDEIDHSTVEVAEEFVDRWRSERSGRACIHTQPQRAFINLQWVNTWQPRLGTKEIALILEDDVDVSPFAYKWLRVAHLRFREDKSLTGYLLQGQNLRLFVSEPDNPKHRRLLYRPANESVFYYPFMGTWGFSPQASNWRYFQNWYGKNKNNVLVKPYVPGSATTRWYQRYEKQGTQDAHWEQWHHYYSYLHGYYCLYNNLDRMAGENGSAWLVANRQEDGLHYHGHSIDLANKLMKQWQPQFVQFPPHPTKVEMDGTIKG